jgi:hypothetical protein
MKRFVLMAGFSLGFCVAVFLTSEFWKPADKKSSELISGGFLLS